MLLFHEEKKLKARVRLTSHNLLEIANPSRIHRCLKLGSSFGWTAIRSSRRWTRQPIRRI